MIIPNDYLTLTSNLYNINQSVYSLEGIGVLYMTLRSFRLISNLFLTFMLPFKLIVLYMPALNLYYFSGLVLTSYLRFGTSGTQIPYNVTNSTNGQYFYFLGTNSDITVTSYMLNANYTTVLPHDCDFTLGWIVFLGILSLPVLCTNRYFKFDKLLLSFTIGSLFELTLASVAQIWNHNYELKQVLYDCGAGTILVIMILIVLRPITSLIRGKLILPTSFSQVLYQKTKLYLVLEQIDLINQFACAIAIPILKDHFVYILYAQAGIYFSQLVLCGAIFIMTYDQNVLYKVHFIINMFSYSLVSVSFALLIYSRDLDTDTQYQYGFIIMVLLGVFVLTSIATQVTKIIIFWVDRHQKQNIIIDETQVQIELELQNPQEHSIQQISEQLVSIEDVSKILDASQQPVFQSTSSNHTQLSDIHFMIPKKRCFELSQFYNTGYIQLNDFIAYYNFTIVVTHNGLEIDPKTVKREKVRILSKNVVQIFNQSGETQNVSIEVKVYQDLKLILKDLRIQDKLITAGSQCEVTQQVQFDVDHPENKIQLKITYSNNKIIRFNLNNTYNKLIRVLPGKEKQYQHQLFTEKTEIFNMKAIDQYCQNHSLERILLDQQHIQFQNQILMVYHARLACLFPNLKYTKGFMQIEVLINTEQYQQMDGSLTVPHLDYTRQQFVNVTISQKHAKTLQPYIDVFAPALMQLFCKEEE